MVTATGIKESLNLLVLHLGTVNLQPDGNNLNSDHRGWLESEEMKMRAEFKMLIRRAIIFVCNISFVIVLSLCL